MIEGRSETVGSSGSKSSSLRLGLCDKASERRHVASSLASQQQLKVSRGPTSDQRLLSILRDDGVVQADMRER